MKTRWMWVVYNVGPVADDGEHCREFDTMTEAESYLSELAARGFVMAMVLMEVEDFFA